MAEDRTTITATIPSGASVSNTIDCNSRSVLGFVAPAAWTSAALNIEASVDGTSWVTVIYDSVGAAIGSWSSLTAGAGYSVDLNGLLPWQFIRLRSGTSTVPVNQGAARAFTIIQRPLA